MGWILFVNGYGKPCAWPDGSTKVEMDRKNEAVLLSCGKKQFLLAARPQHTNDWEQVLMWVEEPDDDVDVVEPGLNEEDED